MKKLQTVASMLALVIILTGAVTGCDNRSQLEKDADKAVGKIEGALK